MEIWKDVPEYKGWYQASSQGKVRSLDRMRKTGRGHGKQLSKGRILVQVKMGGACQNSRYLAVAFSKRGITRCFYVHRVIWNTFRGPIPKKKEINHKDGDKENNRIENLEVGTHKENIKHAIANGLSGIHFKGSKNPRSVLTEEKVRKIKELLKNGENQTWIAKKFQVCKQTITFIKQGKTWTHVQML